MSDESRSQAEHRSLGAWWGAFAMVLAGVAGGLLVGVFTLDRFLNSDASSTGILVGSTVLPAVVAIGLWLTRRRPWCSFAIGLSLCWLGLGIFWATAGDDGMSDEEIDREVAAIRAAGTPAYYLGDEADGHDLAVVSDDGGDRRDWSPFDYGFTCGEGGCRSEVTVETLTVSRDYLEAYGCERLEPVLGVPAAAWDHWLMLFTSDSMVSIDDPDATDEHEGELVLASGLRALGQSEPAEALRPPSTELRTLVDETCGTG